jgi:membrane associated rhomboid family serine protease
VIDLNHILLFLAIISPVAVLARVWRAGPSPAWRLAAIIVLVVTALAWIFFRREAGYVGGGAWLALLFLPAIGLRRVAELSIGRRYKSARKLVTALQMLHPSSEVRQQVHLFRTLEARQAAGLISAPLTRQGDWFARQRHHISSAPVVIALVVLNVAAFAVELRMGYGANPEVLLRLGALDPLSVIFGHQYWRLLTALFLHYGILHLLFNLFALYVLGPPLEKAIGGIRFLVCYLVSGIGSSAGVVLLTLLRLVHPAELVGASGCVMGVVGAWAGLLLRHRHAPNAKRRLSNIVLIIAVQTVFDIFTPQVSMSAHLCGLVTGFLLGLLIAPRRLA